jgi:hypothetical protein
MNIKGVGHHEIVNWINVFHVVIGYRLFWTRQRIFGFIKDRATINFSKRILLSGVIYIVLDVFDDTSIKHASKTQEMENYSV